MYLKKKANQWRHKEIHCVSEQSACLLRQDYHAWLGRILAGITVRVSSEKTLLQAAQVILIPHPVFLEPCFIVSLISSNSTLTTHLIICIRPPYIQATENHSLTGAAPGHNGDGSGSTSASQPAGINPTCSLLMSRK